MDPQPRGLARTSNPRSVRHRGAGADPSTPAMTVTVCALWIRSDVEELGDPATELGQGRFGGDLAVLVDDLNASTRPVDLNVTTVGVHNPDQSKAGAQVVFKLVLDVADAVVGRKHFHGQIGGYGHVGGVGSDLCPP